MLILAAEESPRLTYILDELLLRRLGLNYKITDNPDYFLKSLSFRINYTPQIIEGVLNIPVNNFLHETDIKPQDIEVEKDTFWHTIFFQHTYSSKPDFKSDTSLVNFDLLAAAFYLMSRYEEYLPNKKDEHLRYLGSNSLAYKSGFLEFPLIDFWVIKLGEVLKKQFPALALKTNHFEQINSIDVDFAFKYQQQSIFSSIKKFGGSILRGKPDMEALIKPAKDPYHTYRYMAAKAATKNIPSLFFFLLADYGGYDTNLSPKNIEVQKLYRTIAESDICGLHPSYKAAIDKNALKNEIRLFEEIIHEKPKKVRSHFLKIRLPETYRTLEKLGITEDYTLCYAETTGFRASTCFPFNAFDLIENKTLQVTLHGPCVMDVCLKNYLQLSTQQAIEKIAALKQVVKQVNGQFISIWHNSSFDLKEGWEGWDKVYESLFE
jgi:hypothetical protein